MGIFPIDFDGEVKICKGSLGTGDAESTIYYRFSCGFRVRIVAELTTANPNGVNLA